MCSGKQNENQCSLLYLTCTVSLSEKLMVFDPVWVGLWGINQEVNSNIQPACIPVNLPTFTVYLHSLWTKFTLYSGPFSKGKTKQNQTKQTALVSWREVFYAFLWAHTENSNMLAMSLYRKIRVLCNRCNSYFIFLF